MNYELARKLEIAGFPQDILHYEGSNLDMKIKSMDAQSRSLHRDNPMYFPTLEELIEACGDSLYDLTRVKSEQGIYWVAMDDIRHKSFEEGKLWWGKGSTPEEAVVNLWLALQGKK